MPLIAIAFLGFLFYLATVPADTQGYKAPEKPVRPAAQAPKEPAKPAAKPDAKTTSKNTDNSSYDFYKLLENQKVEVPKVDVYKSTPKDESVSYQYQLQVASFRNKEDADSLRASLLLEGLTAYTKEGTVNNGQWHRVFVGPFDNRSKMNQAQDKLAARGLRPMEIKEPKTK